MASRGLSLSANPQLNIELQFRASGPPRRHPLGPLIQGFAVTAQTCARLASEKALSWGSLQTEEN